ncbi:hypothetical protein IFVP69_C1140015 [Vibrio parahaemolyticus]
MRFIQNANINIPPIKTAYKAYTPNFKLSDIVSLFSYSHNAALSGEQRHHPT